MKNFAIFVLIVLGCSEEYEIQRRICSPFRMTISDALPVQFWVNGVETYNQKEVCGITQACFCQSFNCNDEIRIQVQDSNNQALALVIYDSSGEEITRLAFSETSNGVYELSFIPSENGVCDEVIRFEINNDILSIEATAPEDGYNQTATSDIDWSMVADPPSVNFTVPALSGRTSEHLYKAISPYSEGDIITLHSIILNNYGPGAGGTLNMSARVYFLDSGFNIINFTEIFQLATSSGGATSQEETNDLTVPFGAMYLSIRSIVSQGAAGGNASITTIISTFEDSGFVSAASDCVDIRESHDCTVLIKYLNSKDFADIEYTDFSPNAEFYIRVPAIFFHETNTSEEERFETSGQTIVRLRDEIKVKRRLELGYMPDYMHRKLLLILSHDTIEIDGDIWVRNDPYEKVPPANKRYPLKMANVLLTLQGYIKRNIL